MAHGGGRRAADDRGNRGVWHRRHAGVSFPVGLLVSLWAVWQLLREPWPVVLAAWWALLWRTALVGGALFAAASWALGTAYRSDAVYLLALAFVLPTSVWAAWGIVCVVERRMVDPS